MLALVSYLALDQAHNTSEGALFIEIWVVFISNTRAKIQHICALYAEYSVYIFLKEF